MKYFRIIIFCISIIATSTAQELNCKIIIRTDAIQPAFRDNLRNFVADVEQYMNNTRFTNENLDNEKISCTFEVYFKSATSDNRYSAQVYIVSQRPIFIDNYPSTSVTPILRILDNNWDFTYLPNQRINHDELSFDPFTGFLNYYAYLIIGYDMESYVPMSGTNVFQKALNLVQRAGMSSVGGAEWRQSTTPYSRFNIIDDLNNLKYTQFKNAFNNYHFNGIDLLPTDNKLALDNIIKSIEQIYDVKRKLNSSSILVKLFFDAKYTEIADIFSSYPDKSIYDKLSIYDEEHRSTYQNAKTKQ